jgi:hypothetical protein
MLMLPRLKVSIPSIIHVSANNIILNRTPKVPQNPPGVNEHYPKCTANLGYHSDLTLLSRQYKVQTLAINIVAHTRLLRRSFCSDYTRKILRVTSAA